MCLLVHPDSQPRVLEEDLEVYKIVNRTVIGKTIWYTSLFYHFNYDIGRLYTSEIQTKFMYPANAHEMAYYPECVNDGKYGAIEEALHTFASLEDAQACASYDALRVVLRCVIPAGSKVYDGKWEYCTVPFDDTSFVKVDSIASDALRVMELIA